MGLEQAHCEEVRGKNKLIFQSRQHTHLHAHGQRILGRVGYVNRDLSISGEEEGPRCIE